MSPGCRPIHEGERRRVSQAKFCRGRRGFGGHEMFIRLSWLGVILQSERSMVQFLVRAHAWVAGSVQVGVGVCTRGK